MSNTYRLLADCYEAMMDDVLYAIYLELIDKHTTPSKLLEVGCGTGTIARACAHKGYRVDAFDQDETMLELANHYAVSEGVNVQFFLHDMHEGFSGAYDTIIVPIDVLNHASSFDALTQTIESIKQSVLVGGVVIFDLLKEDYLKSLDGHHEVITEQGETIEWQVQAFEGGVKHRVKRNNATQEHREFYYPLKRVLQQFSGFGVVEKVPLECRDIVVLKREK